MHATTCWRGDEERWRAERITVQEELELDHIAAVTVPAITALTHPSSP